MHVDTYDPAQDLLEPNIHIEQVTEIVNLLQLSMHSPHIKMDTMQTLLRDATATMESQRDMIERLVARNTKTY